MKKYLWLIPLFACFFSAGQENQKTERFYNYAGKECDFAAARYYDIIEFKDGLWFRLYYFTRGNELLLQGSYQDKNCKTQQGLFQYFYRNGSLKSTGKYENGEKQGLWLGYDKFGNMSDSAFYNKGHLTATAMQWYPNGNLKDSAVFNDDGKAVHVSWYDNGYPSSAGITFNDTMNGKWQFFHKNGRLSAVEIYEQGRLTSREYYNENGMLLQDTTNRDRPAKFPGGEQAWHQYITSRSYLPQYDAITAGDKAIVLLDAMIDENGNVTNIEVASPYYPAFDYIAVKALKKSPKWKPAISHNRAVQVPISQAITFVQKE